MVSTARRQSAALYRDGWFWLAVAAALVFWAVLAGFEPIGWRSGLAWTAPLAFVRVVLVIPLLEEIVFRGLVQGWLAGRWPRRWGPVSGANLVTSVLFAASHLAFHPPVWAAATFIPSLVFGAFKDRYTSLHAPIIVHVFYNAGYYGLFG